MPYSVTLDITSISKSSVISNMYTYTHYKSPTSYLSMVPSFFTRAYLQFTYYVPKTDPIEVTINPPSIPRPPDIRYFYSLLHTVPPRMTLGQVLP